MPSPTQLLGACAERIAEEFLRARGLSILHRNFHQRAGELDLVAREGQVLVIAEVRLRSGRACGGAAASIDARKQRRIVRATQRLLQHHPHYARLPVRFDALLVEAPRATAPRVTWIRHAFEAPPA